MSVDKVLDEQRQWLEKATARLERLGEGEKAIPLVAEIRDRRLAEIQVRIERLEAQKEVAQRRYDLAIASEVAERDRLAHELAWNPDGPDKPIGPVEDVVRPRVPPRAPIASRATRASGRGSNPK